MQSLNGTLDQIDLIDIYISFSCLMLWLGLPVLCWIRMQSWHYCLVPDLGRSAFNILPLTMILSSVQLLSHVQLFVTPWIAGCQAFLSNRTMILVVGFIIITSIVLRYVPSICTLLRVFVMKEYWIFWKDFSDLLRW